MNTPFSVTVTMDDPAWDSPYFERSLYDELFRVAEVFRAERERRRVDREVFWLDIGRAPDAHLGAVGGE